MRHDYSEQFNRTKAILLGTAVKFADEYKTFNESMNKFEFGKYEDMVNKSFVHTSDIRHKGHTSITMDIGRMSSLSYCGIPAKLQNILHTKVMNKIATKPSLP